MLRVNPVVFFVVLGVLTRAAEAAPFIDIAGYHGIKLGVSPKEFVAQVRTYGKVNFVRDLSTSKWEAPDKFPSREAIECFDGTHLPRSFIVCEFPAKLSYPQRQLAAFFKKGHKLSSAHIVYRKANARAAYREFISRTRNGVLPNEDFPGEQQKLEKASGAAELCKLGRNRCQMEIRVGFGSTGGLAAIALTWQPLNTFDASSREAIVVSLYDLKLAGAYER